MASFVSVGVPSSSFKSAKHSYISHRSNRRYLATTRCTLEDTSTSQATDTSTAPPSTSSAAATPSSRPIITNERTQKISELLQLNPDLDYAGASATLAAANDDLEKALELLDDTGKVSKLELARLRRTATGSARDFFKGYVEVRGQHIDTGYVDENADAMGNFVKGVKGWWNKVTGGSQK